MHEGEIPQSGQRQRIVKNPWPCARKIKPNSWFCTASEPEHDDAIRELDSYRHSTWKWLFDLSARGTSHTAVAAVPCALPRVQGARDAIIVERASEP